MSRTTLISRASILPLLTAVLMATLISSRGDPDALRGHGGRLVPVHQHTTSASPVVPGEQVALRQLIIATDAEDFGLGTWKSILDRVGTPYDVLLAEHEALEHTRLVRPDGRGRYSSVLLASSGLLFQDRPDSYISALDPQEWNTLWNYERTFDVRQVAINASPGTFPEDYCLQPETEEAVGATPVNATLTATGADIFAHLRPDVRIPITHSYLYRSRTEQGCDATPVLTTGSSLLGAMSTSLDGRERIAMTLTLGAGQAVTDLLGYGLLHWATKGVFLGEQRHWINVDVDDWFLPTLRLHPDGTSEPFRLTGADAAAVDRQQTALRNRYRHASNFTLNLPFNAGMLDMRAPIQCDPTGTPDSLSSYSRCLVDRFRWINHTLTHPKMDFTPYDQSYTEIAENLAVADSAGIPVPADVLKTPEYSGLGVYSTPPDSETNPTDHGLISSNRELLRAASDLGARYLHGNLSFAGHRPSCFNCGVYHPLQPDLFVVPDWPTNISFEATTPEEQTHYYNAVYGRNGRSEDRIGHDLEYKQIVQSEADIALKHVMNGSSYTHTVHQGNLHEYAPGKSLAFDWLNAVLEGYSTFFDAPLENPDWPTLAKYVQDRNAHFAALMAADDAVWNRSTNAITYTPTAAGSLFLTGLATRPAVDADEDHRDEADTYGSDSVSRVGLSEGDTVTLTANPALGP